MGVVRLAATVLVAVALASCSRNESALPIQIGQHPTTDTLGARFSPRTALDQRVRNAVLFRIIHRFRGAQDGASPWAALLSVNGTLYGTTYYGGGSGCENSLGCGTVFALNPSSGEETVVHRFRGGNDGASPQAALVTMNGTLYGTTVTGGGSGCGGNGCGTVFSVNPSSGQEKVVYRFRGGVYGPDGAHPEASLTALDGTLYGTTLFGGSPGYGTVFALNPSSGRESIYSFNLYDGANPRADLITVNGKLYGTTANGGGAPCGDCGTIFALDTSLRHESVLYAFQGGKDGVNPTSRLRYLAGTLYGTTSTGGSGCASVPGCGTIFGYELSSRTERVLYRFKGGLDGAYPYAGVDAANGALYGTTVNGGSRSGAVFGTVFTFDVSSRRERVLYRFQGGNDGAGPFAALIAKNGTLFGAAISGGGYKCGCGTVFAITP